MTKDTTRSGRLLTCFPFAELGHISKNCTQEFMEPTDQPSISCSNCNEAGHRLRDCTKPRVDPNVCRNCKRPGHRGAECTEPRSAEGVECKRCNEGRSAAGSSFCRLRGTRSYGCCCCPLACGLSC